MGPRQRETRLKAALNSATDTGIRRFKTLSSNLSTGNPRFAHIMTGRGSTAKASGGSVSVVHDVDVDGAEAEAEEQLDGLKGLFTVQLLHDDPGRA